MNLQVTDVEAYLTQRFQQTVRVLALQPLDGRINDSEQNQSLKVYGYGQPILIRYEVAGAERSAVFRTVAASPFGHDHRADRAANLLFSYDTFNDLPQHVRALDVGVILADNRLASLGTGGEFFLLTDYAAGALYAEDLQRLRDTGALTELDIRRAEQLAGYLAEAHAAKRADPALYRRAVRDLLGSGEGIMGLTDSYPPDFPLADAAWLERVEQSCVSWRWRLKTHPQRLARIHGDFHPFNVLFGTDSDFWLLDRSRGGWGDPADDVSCMAINYLFFSLQRSGALAPPFSQLWDAFWHTYLARTGDQELLAVVAPFFAWRALVVASPLWYNVADPVRLALFRLIDNILSAPVFEPDRVNDYLVA